MRVIVQTYVLAYLLPCVLTYMSHFVGVAVPYVEILYLHHRGVRGRRGAGGRRMKKGMVEKAITGVG